MITLHQPAPMLGLANVSPYSMKLEALMGWQEIPFNIQEDAELDLAAGWYFNSIASTDLTNDGGTR
ncbi:hypothetical protein NBRC116188_19850 [Oceaniserpentilla sp. 4NH20-0058]|uniref:hypothetical protein n=1 Tax=Oceaniserpentilla sp. 4NH20-0058 TaxID=3127660 RepID=UPI00310307FB